MQRYCKTVNIHCGKKLSRKSRDDILSTVLAGFQKVECVQQCLDIIRVTFTEERHALAVLKENGVYLCGKWCRLEGGPPTTILHVFDFPYEETEETLKTFFSDYGVV